MGDTTFNMVKEVCMLAVNQDFKTFKTSFSGLPTVSFIKHTIYNCSYGAKVIVHMVQKVNLNISYKQRSTFIHLYKFTSFVDCCFLNLLNKNMCIKNI